jgi:cyclohexanecarboxyl-CoA dehydrogenase
METLFGEEQLILQQTVRQYAQEKLLPEYSLWDRGTPFPSEKVRDLGRLGLLGIRVPEAYGGSDESFVSLGIAAQELGRGDFNVTLFLQLGTIAAEMLRAYACEEVRREWLPGIASGEKIVAFGLTEPGAGSDAAALAATARRKGDTFVVQGEKASITFAGSADACIVFARTGGGGARGIGTLLVPLDLPGVSRQVYPSSGGRLSQRGSLFFDDVRVPAENLLGEEGGGFVQAMEAFDYNRAIIALGCIGAADQSIDETVEFAKQRVTFGEPIAKREGVSFQIAEHLTWLSAARLLAYQTLALKDRQKPHTSEAAMSKWLGPKVAAEAIHACMLLHGWPGYGTDLPFEQRLRDVIGFEVGDGTPEIMKGIIARELFGRGFTSYR